MTEPAPPVPAVVYTATIGTIAPFQPETDRIELYLERVALYMEANNFPDERKVPALLSIMGGPIYEVLRSLLAPELTQAQSYDQLVATLKQHFAPKPLVIAERFHVHRRGQRSKESISEYMAELRKLSLHCEFGDYLNQALRDRLICGLSSEAVQKRLLAESDLPLTRAMSLAQGMEAAAKNTLTLKGQEVAINRVAEPAGKGPPSANGANWAVNSTRNFTNFKVERCYRCGGGNHAPAQCRFRDATCHKCGKGGHIASACRGRAKPTGSQRSRRPNVRTNWVTEDSDIDDELYPERQVAAISHRTVA